LGDPLKGNLLLLYKPLHLEAQQVSTRIEVRRHQIRKLKQPDGSWTCDTAAMEDLATDFFQSLFTRDEAVNPNIITDMISPCITDDMNNNLCAPFSEKQISDALF
jgi:hypothetical protein